MFQQQAFLDGYLDKSAQSVDMLARGKAGTPRIQAQATDQQMPPFKLTAVEQAATAPKDRTMSAAPSLANIFSSSGVPPRKASGLPAFKLTAAEKALSRGGTADANRMRSTPKAEGVKTERALLHGLRSE